MNLTIKDLEKFKAIYKSRYNIELTNKQALEYGTSLINFIKILLSNSTRIGK